jgi:hypothetical protein
MKSCDPGAYLLFIDPDRSQKLTNDPDRSQKLTVSGLVWFGFLGSFFALSKVGSCDRAAGSEKIIPDPTGPDSSGSRYSRTGLDWRAEFSRFSKHVECAYPST